MLVVVFLVSLVASVAESFGTTPSSSSLDSFGCAGCTSPVAGVLLSQRSKLFRTERKYLDSALALSASGDESNLVGNMNKNHPERGGEEEDTEVVGQMRGGLVFLKTSDREGMVRFYTDRIGMSIWLEQPDITILCHGNMVLGFHQITAPPSRGDGGEGEAGGAPSVPPVAPETSGMYTFVYPSRSEVDDMHARLSDIADGPPRTNDRYRIYQFFAADPEGRALEFQAFLHPLAEVSSRP